jgi:hypothetical protein
MALKFCTSIRNTILKSFLAGLTASVATAGESLDAPGGEAHSVTAVIGFDGYGDRSDSVADELRSAESPGGDRGKEIAPPSSVSLPAASAANAASQHLDPPTFNPPILADGVIILSWTGDAILQQTSDLTANPVRWKDVAPRPTGNRYLAPAAQFVGRIFFRLS